MIAVVPVKALSERVLNKNFREFACGMSLLEWKLRQIMTSGAFHQVYVSSDSEHAARIAEETGAIFIKRAREFCNNIVPWSDVIFEVVSSLPVSGDIPIAWCHTTSPLFDRYAEAKERYENRGEDKDGLIAVKELKEFIVTDRGRPLNYHWGPWHEYSQSLQGLYAVTGALFITQKEIMLRNRYVVSSSPLYFITPEWEAVDLDTEYDFALAQLIYSHLDTFNK